LLNGTRFSTRRAYNPECQASLFVFMSSSILMGSVGVSDTNPEVELCRIKGKYRIFILYRFSSGKSGQN